MLKLLVVLLAFASFAAALLVPLGLSGNLNREGLEKILKRDAQRPVEAPQPDPATPLLRALNQQREALERREEELKEEEQRLRAMHADLEELREKVRDMLFKVQTTLSEEDEAHDERLQEVAQALSRMNPRNAAETMNSFTPDEAARVLRLIRDRDRIRILDAMDQEQAALILRTLQEPRI